VQFLDPVLLDQIDVALQILELFALLAGARRRGRGGLGKLLQVLDRKADDLAGPMALVHQPLDEAQLVDLVDRVGALAEDVASRLREAVAALPHAQRVLGQAGIAFDGGDRSGDRGLRGAIVHEPERGATAPHR